MWEGDRKQALPTDGVQGTPEDNISCNVHAHNRIAVILTATVAPLLGGPHLEIVLEPLAGNREVHYEKTSVF